MIHMLLLRMQREDDSWMFKTPPTIPRPGYGIRCNSVHPGLINTDMGQNSMHMGGGNPEENYKNRVALTPMGEAGSPIDIANGVLFLASEEARHVTGAELVIDGGLTAV